jgi:hypothetical protein
MVPSVFDHVRCWLVLDRLAPYAVTITATMIATSVIDNYASAIDDRLDEQAASMAVALLVSGRSCSLPRSCMGV